MKPFKFFGKNEITPDYYIFPAHNGTYTTTGTITTTQGWGSITTNTLYSTGTYSTGTISTTGYGTTGTLTTSTYINWDRLNFLGGIQMEH